jgi:superfamily II DNA or RNA helicase
MYLSKYGYVIPKSELTSKQLVNVKKDLVAKPLSDDKYYSDNTFNVYRETSSKITVPLQYGLVNFGEPDKFTSSYRGESIPKIKFTGTLRDEQKEPYQKMYDRFKDVRPNNPKGGVMSLATGKGKTFLATKLICELGRKTLVLVNKLSLLDQWVQELDRFSDGLRVGVVQGKNVDIIDKHVIVATIQSTVKGTYPDTIFDDISMVIMDECHNVSSKMFSTVLFNVASPIMLGLSATPTRSDGLDTVLHWWVSGLIYQTPKTMKKPKLQIQIVKCRSENYKEVHTINKATRQQQLQFTSMLSHLVNMKSRNELIVDVIIDVMNAESQVKRKVLVMSDRREHIKQLYELLKERNVSFTFAPFVGSMKIGTLNENRKCDVILATTAAFSEGVSEKDLNTLILVSPKKFVGHLTKQVKKDSGKMEQIVGRIFRKEHTDIIPKIIDIADDFSVYRVHLSQRLVFYKQHFPEYQMINSSVDLDKYTGISDVSIEKRIKKMDSPIKNEYCLLE